MFGFFIRSETLKNLKQASNPAQKCPRHFFVPTLKPCYNISMVLIAETAGFEPAGAFTPHFFSKEAQ